MIELVRDLRTINVLAKFENDPWKIMDVRVLTGLVCPAARPPARPPTRPPARSGYDNTPEPEGLRGKNEFRNVKRGRLIKWSIMSIFNEAEPPWSNLSEI